MVKPKKAEAALERAIEIAGSGAALARLLGVTRQAIAQWDRVPPVHAMAIEKATKGAVRCHELRPDIFPRPQG